MHEITIPPPDPDSAKTWRKLLTSLDEEQPGGKALTGHWLDAGAVYELPAGVLVVGFDEIPGTTPTAGYHIRLWRVTPKGSLKAERDSTFRERKSSFGASVRRTLRTALAKPTTTVSAIPPVLVKPGPPRPPRQVRENLYDGACLHCGQTVAAYQGVLLADGAGRSRPAHGLTGDTCPPHPAPQAPVAPQVSTPTAPARKAAPAAPDAPAWRISYGEPGRYRSRPTGGYTIGAAGRHTVWEHEHQVPVDTPGYRRVDDRTVSAIFTVVSERRPVYCRDEDGNNPADLVGQDGWLFQATVRPATASEAADLLAAEATDLRRAQLDADRRRLLSYIYSPQPDATAPEQVTLAGYVRVPTHRNPTQAGPEDEIHVDEAAGTVVTLDYNGSDGSDWSINNHRSYVARVHPLTPDRADLIARLRAEYGVSDMARRARIDRTAAEVLLAAGWTGDDAAARLGGITVPDATAATKLTTAPVSMWTTGGWAVHTVLDYRPGQHRFTPAEAILLHSVDISYRQAADLHKAGTSVAHMPAARPLTVPADATQIIIRGQYGAMITGDPAAAQATINGRAELWHGDALIARVGPTCVHTAGSWSLWDDGSLVRDATWISLDERKRVPDTLSPAAVAAIGLVVKAAHGSPVQDRAVWHPLLDAVDHDAEVVDEDEQSSSSRWAGKKLTRHTFRTPTGVVVWWELETFEGDRSGEDADHRETTSVYIGEHEARAAYTRHRIR